MSLPLDGVVVIVPVVSATEPNVPDVALTVVNVPAAGVIAPMVVPLIAPPEMATKLALCVDMVPNPVMSVLGIVEDAVRAEVPVPLT